MAGHRYTIEELKHLRESPLVCKPAELPSIEQWMEQSQPEQSTQPQRKQTRAPSARLEEPQNSVMGAFGQNRPSLSQTRPLTRTSSTGKLENGSKGQRILETPVWPFPVTLEGSRDVSGNVAHIARARMMDETLQLWSNCRISANCSPAAEDVVLGPPKTSFASSRNFMKLPEATDRAHDDDPVPENTNARARFFKERDTEKRDRNSTGVGRRLGKEDAEQDARDTRNGDRQNGRSHAPEKVEQRWSRDTNNMTKGGERDRESTRDNRGWRDKEQRTERASNWNRGGTAERDPEWMDEPLEKGEKRSGHTQEDFQRWKERMKAGSSAEDKSEGIESETSGGIKDTMPEKTTTPLVPERGAGFSGLGGWGVPQATEAESAPPGPLPKPSATKGKPSRFANFFAPKEETAASPSTNMSLLAGLDVQSPGLVQAKNGSSEDKEGFARILQMLGGSSSSISPNPVASANGSGGFADLLASKPSDAPPPTFSSFGNPGPEKPMSQLLAGPELSLFDQVLMTQPMPSGKSVGRGEGSGRKEDIPERTYSQPERSIFLDPPPSTSRGGPTPDMNVQHLIAQRPTSLSRDSDAQSQFLLNLIQTKNASRPPSQARQVEQDSNFQIFMDQPPKLSVTTQAPKPRAPAPPPGFYEEQLFRGGQHPDVQMSPERQQPPRRPPPGFFDDPSIAAQHQQRSYPAVQPPRRQPHPHMLQHFSPEELFHSVGQDRQPMVQHQQQRMQPPPGFYSAPLHPLPHVRAGMPESIQGTFPGIPGPGAPPGFYSGPPPGFPPQVMRGGGLGRGFEGFPR
ncbi:hypothetical protein LTR66_002432 [Elasticomyces elasticus]|nr:hypothetical protein LTR66_002432 [Elasticomyces elasticus]